MTTTDHTIPPTGGVRKGLVSKDGARVERSVYVDRELYQRELEVIFGKSWLPLGHESQLPRKGSFFTSYMGEDAVIVARGSDSQIHVHLNACSHRGARVCLEDSGTAKSFTCPYHAWTFATDGRLVGVAMEDALYKSAPIDKSAYGLTPVAKVETIHGMIFATFDPDAPPLRESLGNMVPFLDAIFDRHEDGVEVIGPPQKWRVPTNWKIYQDNFAGDEYHVSSTHGSAVEAIGLDWEGYLAEHVRHVYVDGGHGFAAKFEPPNGAEKAYSTVEQPSLFSPETQAYFEQDVREAEQRVSAIHLRCQLIAGCVFPNWSLLPVYNTFRVCHPKGPNEIELWSYFFVAKNAPEQVKAELGKAYNFGFGPAGIIEQDDSAVWESIARTAQGAQGRRGAANYTMGLGEEQWHESLGAMITDRLSEAAQRNFYRHWAHVMEVGE